MRQNFPQLVCENKTSLRKVTGSAVNKLLCNYSVRDQVGLNLCGFEFYILHFAFNMLWAVLDRKRLIPVRFVHCTPLDIVKYQTILVKAVQVSY